MLLTWIALGLSALALAHAALLGKRPLAPELRLFVVAAIALLALGAAATLPTAQPWSQGQALAPSFVLGGLAVLAGALLGASGSAAPIAAPAAGMSVLVLFWHYSILDSCGGFALGALMVAILLSACRTDPELASAAELAALSATTLAAATFLGTFHKSPAGVREWQPLPSLLAAVIAGGLAARSALSRTGESRVVGIAVVVMPLAAIAALVSFRLGGTQGFWKAAAAGLIVFALAGWLGSSRGETPRGLGRWFRADYGLLASLLVLGGVALAFKAQHGFGVAIAVLAALAVAALARDADARETLRTAIVIGLMVALYRVFNQEHQIRKAFQPELIYYYVALIAGALLPLLLAGVASSESDRTAPSLLRTGLAGLGAALAPLVIYLMVGLPPLGAFLIGLAVGAGLLLSGWGPGAFAASPARLLSLGAAWSAIQFTLLMDHVGLHTRGERIGVLVALAAIALVGVVVTALLERRSGVSEAAPAGVQA